MDYAEELKKEYGVDKHTNVIEIKIDKIDELFNSLDPSPFLKKSLNEDVYEYIWYSIKNSLRSKHKLIIHLKGHKKTAFLEAKIKEAIRNNFKHRTKIAERDIDLEIAEGRNSLVIGLTFLIVCILVAQYLAKTYETALSAVSAEILHVVGWVAMWKPISNLLYDWWPLNQEKKVYKQMTIMDIEFKYTS